MSLVRAIADIKRFTTKEFSVTINFTSPSGEVTAIVQGLASKHNLSIDPETGIPINSKNCHISVAESNLIDEGYTTRNSDNDIDLINHYVSWIDASGISFNYRIDQTYPSETTGLIVCILGEL